MRKFAAVSLGVTVSLLFVNSSTAAVKWYTASITHDQEPGGVPDQGSSGEGTFYLNDDDPLNPWLSYNITLTGLDIDGLQTPGDPNDNVTRTHFHGAAFGVNGGIIFGQIDASPTLQNDLDDLVVDPVAGTIKGRWDNAEGNGQTLAQRIAAGLFNLDANNRTSVYFNVHTADHAGGEVRGQLTLVPEPTTGMLCLLGLVPLWFAKRRT